jgi:hypothetical protein
MISKSKCYVLPLKFPGTGEYKEIPLTKSADQQYYEDFTSAVKNIRRMIKDMD